MAATVEIDEQNGTAPGSATANITNSNYGSVDSPNLDAVASPIAKGSNSYEKWQRFHISAMGGSSKIDNLKFFRSAGSPTSGCTHKFNGHTVQGTYDSSKKTTFETPGTGTTKTPNDVPSSAPGTANIGISGSLSGNLSAPGYSDFVVHQLRADASATAGTVLTLTYRYDETA